MGPQKIYQRPEQRPPQSGGDQNILEVFGWYLNIRTFDNIIFKYPICDHLDSCQALNQLQNWIDHLVGGWATNLKNMSSSVGMMTFPIFLGKSSSHVPGCSRKTTNQMKIESLQIRQSCLWSRAGSHWREPPQDNPRPWPSAIPRKWDPLANIKWIDPTHFNQGLIWGVLDVLMIGWCVKCYNML